MTADAHNAVVALVAMYSQLLEAQEKQFQAVAAELGRAVRHADEQRAVIAARDKDLAEAKAEVTRVHDEALRVLDARHKRVAELEAELRSLCNRQDQAGSAGSVKEPAPEEVEPPCAHPPERRKNQIQFGQNVGTTCGECGEWTTGAPAEYDKKRKKNYDGNPF